MIHTGPSNPGLPVSINRKTYSWRHHVPLDSSQLLVPSKVSSLLAFQTFSLLVPRFPDLIEFPVSRPPFQGDISVEARAIAICPAEAVKHGETHHQHHLRSRDHWSSVPSRLRSSAVSRCHSLRAKMKAFLRFTECCRRAIVAMATIMLI